MIDRNAAPAADVRRALLQNGYSPLPCSGKAPPLKNWQQKFETNTAEIDLWSKTWPCATNTGILCRFTPCLDIDVLDAEAAGAVEDFVRERFEDAGYVLTRIGKAPKRAVPFRTQEPFAKIAVPLIAPNGDTSQKLEFLCDGQQIVVAGTHPDTSKPYTWFGKSLLDVPHDELPYIRAHEAQQLIDEATELLIAAHGYKRTDRREKKVNGDVRDNGARADWVALTGKILRGESLHDSTVSLAASYIGSGLSPEHTLRQLRALMLAGTAAHDERWQARLDDLPRIVSDADAKFGKGGGSTADTPLPYVNLTATLTEREWLVADRIPMFNVTSLSGDGAVGKSTLLLQLSAACVLRRYWIGTLPIIGSVLYFCAEDDEAEICRRLEAIALHFETSRQELFDAGLRVLSFAGRDAVLGVPDREGLIKPTPLFERIKHDAIALRPKLIVVDPIADVFAGNEVNRAQSRQFITLMRGLAIDAGSAVVMAAHPSLNGITTDSGNSGSTAWHNSVRARLYLKPAGSDDKTLRVLEVKKNNYGPVTDTIVLRWKDGVYIVEAGKGTLQRLAAEQAIDHLFMTLLRRFAGQGRNVTDKPGTSYAPAQFAKQSEAEDAKITSKEFAKSMERLFEANKIKVVSEGSASRQRTRLVDLASTDPSTDLPPPSTVPCTPPPHTPRPGGSGLPGAGTPARPTGQPEKRSQAGA